MNAELMEHIEHYLDGQISRKELQRIAQSMGVEDLGAEIQWVVNTRTAIEAAGLREQLREALPRPQNKVRRLRTFLAIAASLLVLALTYWGITRETGSSLYLQYEYVDPGLPVLMSQSENHRLYDAMTYYGEGNYAVAAEKLRQLRREAPANDTITYYLGASSLYQGQTTDARQSLEKVLELGNSEFEARAQWLLVLTELKTQNIEATKSRLKSILGNPEHEFHAQAERLNNELEK